MKQEPKPLRFGQHALAALGASMLGSTILSLVWIAALVAVGGDQIFGITSLATLAAICWLGVFLIALPTAGAVFSLLWPVTRRMTTMAKCICIGAGATVGIIYAPLASPKLHGASINHLSLSALAGATIAVIYLVMIARSSARSNPAGPNAVKLESVNL